MISFMIVWAAKESLYKSFSEKSVSFIQNINVDEFTLDCISTTATVNYNNKKHKYAVDFFEFDGFTCAYSLVLNDSDLEQTTI